MKDICFNYFTEYIVETPLTIAASLEKPRNVIIALVSGGAHIDYRNRKGFTAIHQAAAKGNYDGIKVSTEI